MKKQSLSPFVQFSNKEEFLPDATELNLKNIDDQKLYNFRPSLNISEKSPYNFIGLNQFMEGENLKNLVDQKRRSLSEGLSTKEEDTEERDDDDVSSHKN